MDVTQRRRNFSDLKDLDMTMIDEIPWAKEMWKVLLNGLTKTFLNWTLMASKMGKTEEDMKEWIETFIEHYEDTCCELVSAMEVLQSDLIASIEKSLEKLEKYCKTLQVAMPVFGQENLGLYQEHDRLKSVIEDYELRIEKKRTELKKLHEKQLDLCHSLGRNIKILEVNPFPTEEEIQKFRNYLDDLEQEQFNRFEKFCDTKKEIHILTKELNFKPSTKFEAEILASDDSNFLLTDENMRELANFYKTLKKEKENVREEISDLRSKIDDLWNLLEIPLLEREEFRQKYTGWSYGVLDILRSELRRCENLKKANIKVFVDKLRLQLTKIWDKCHCAESVRNKFSLFHSDCYTEDLLELHEFELRRWNAYYEEHKEILNLLEKHSSLWSKMIELEKSAVNPDRFNNRGGQLLKEEKERNALSKEIPKIEKSLTKLADQFFIHNGNPFQTYGETIEDYIANLHADRENNKRLKLSSRKMQNTMQTLTPSKSVQCLFPTTSASKRKLPTPHSVLNKKTKDTPGYSATSSKKVKVPTIVVSSITNAKRLSVERKKRLEKIRRRSALKESNAKKIGSSISSEYLDFENEISVRKDCRSTMHSCADSAAEQLPQLPVACVPKGQLTPKHPLSRKGTPTTSRSPGNVQTNLTAAKSNLKLIF